MFDPKMPPFVDEQVAEYSMMAVPPLLAGAENLTVTAPALAVAVTPIGADGTVLTFTVVLCVADPFVPEQTSV